MTPQNETEPAAETAEVWEGEPTQVVYVDALALGFNRHTLTMDLGQAQLGGGRIRRQVRLLLNPHFAAEIQLVLRQVLRLHKQAFSPKGSEPPAPPPAESGGFSR